MKSGSMRIAVSYIDVSRDDLRYFAQGHGGEDEWLTDDAAIRSRAQPVGPDAMKALNHWAASQRGAQPQPTTEAPPLHDYMAEYEANQARIAAEPAPEPQPVETLLARRGITKNPLALGVSLAIAAFLGWSLPARAYTGEELAKQAAIDMPQARSLALNARPGKITKEELEKEPGGSGLRYPFVIQAGVKLYEVGVDAHSGALVENKPEGPNPD